MIHDCGRSPDAKVKTYWTLAKINFTTGNNQYTNTVMTSGQLKKHQTPLSKLALSASTPVPAFYPPIHFPPAGGY